MNARYAVGQAVEISTYPEGRREGVITRTPAGESPYYEVSIFGKRHLVTGEEILGELPIPNLDDPDAVEAFLGG